MKDEKEDESRRPGEPQTTMWSRVLGSGPAIAKCHAWVSTNIQNLFSPYLGGWKSENQVFAALVSSGGSVEESVLSPGSWWLLEALCFPWWVDTSLQSLPLSSHHRLPFIF